jgi:hypothetical protein
VTGSTTNRSLKSAGQREVPALLFSFLPVAVRTEAAEPVSAARGFAKIQNPNCHVAFQCEKKVAEKALG